MSHLTDYVAAHPRGDTTQAGFSAAIAADAAMGTSPSLWDYIVGGQAMRDGAAAVTAPFSAASTAVGNIGQGAADAARSLASTADTIVTTAKWIGIALLVVVGALVALWIAAAVFGLKIAAETLVKVAPSLASGAASYARVAS